MVSKDKISLINDVVSFCIKELNVDIKSNKELSHYIKNDINEEKVALMILANTFLTHYPLYKGHVCNMPWPRRDLISLFEGNYSEENTIIGDNYEYDLYTMLDYEINPDLYYDHFISLDELYNEEKTLEEEYGTFVSGGRRYINDVTDVINKEYEIYKNLYKKREEELDYEYDYSYDEELITCVSKALRNGNKIIPNMLCHFIRNGFAHFGWEYNEERKSVYLFHVDEKKGEKDLETNISLLTLYRLIFKYVNILVEKYPNHPSYSLVDKMVFEEISDLYEELNEINFISDILNEIKDTELYEDFKNKLEIEIQKNHFNDITFYSDRKEKLLNYVLKYGNLDKDNTEYVKVLINDKEHNELDLTWFTIDVDIPNYDEVVRNFVRDYPMYDVEYDNRYAYMDTVQFIKEYFTKHLSLINNKKRLILSLYKSLDIVEDILGIESDAEIDNSYEEDLEVKEKNTVEFYVDELKEDSIKLVLVKTMLNALFAQIDYSDIDLSSINFDSMQLSDKYIKQLNDAHNLKVSNINSIMVKELMKCYKDYYIALGNKLNGKGNAEKQLEEASNRINNYSDFIFNNQINIDKSHHNLMDKTRNMKNLEIIEHIRNSCCHGNIDIVFDNSNVMNSFIIVKDYDKGILTFEGTFRLNDLLLNILNPEITNQLDPKPLRKV